MRHRTLLLAVALCVFSAGAAAGTTPRMIDTGTVAAASGWKIQRMDLDITVAAEEESLAIDGRMILELVEAPSRALAVLMNTRWPVMKLDALRVVAATELDPAEVHIERNLQLTESDSMRITLLRLPREAATGETVELAFTCHSSGKSMQVIVGPDGAYASWVEAWYPVPVDDNDPEDPHSGSHARGPGRTTFRLPAGWWALSNGTRVERTTTDRGTVDVWEDGFGTARSFVAAPYLEPEEVVVGDRTVAVYLVKPKPLAARAQAERLSQAIDVLSSCFGPYPFGTFAIAEAPASVSSFGAASEQGFIVAKSFFMSASDGNLALFAHEAGHTWWGNLVSTAGPGSQLCSESLSQYGAVLAIEAIEGKQAARDFMEFSRVSYVPNQCARGYFDIVRAGTDRPLSALDGSAGVDHTLADAKGHWIYHMLRQEVGDSVFFDTLRDVVVRYTDEQLSLEQLRREFIASAPGADLETFFAQWLDRTGAPVIDARWSLVEKEQEGTGGPFDVMVTLEQMQEGEPYVFDVEIALELEDGASVLRTVRVDGNKAADTVRVGALPATLELDPRRKILMWRPAYGPKPVADASTPD